VPVVILLDKKRLIEMIKDRHTNQSSFDTGEWTNHHGLDRCDCEDLVEWVESLDE
jgi:hypothetical protein